MSLANLSHAEGLWATVAFALLVMDLYLLREALRDKESVALRDGAARLLVAGGNIRREVSRVLVQAIILFVALFNGLFAPPPFLPAVDTTLTVTIFGLIAAQVVLIYSAWRDTEDRRTLLASAIRQLRAGRLEVKEIDGRVIIESAPGAPAPVSKHVGATIVTSPTTDELGTDE